MNADSGADLLAALADVFTIGGFVVAAAAIWFAGRQLRIQARSQKLTAVLETNKLWWDVPSVRSAMLPAVTLSSATADAVARVYRCVVADKEAAVGPWPQPRPDLSQPVPFVLGGLLPATTGNGPSSEAEYRLAMLDRALSVGLVLTALQAIADGDGTTEMLDGWAPDDVTRTAVRTDLSRLRGAIDRYVGALNEVVELYDARLIDRRLFLGKRHVAVIQQAFAVEPYVLWRNTIHGGRWGMRCLSIGQAARAFHWAAPMHGGGLTLRADPDGYARGAQSAGLAARIGEILSSPEPRPRAGLGWRRRALAAGFSVRDRRAQNRLRSTLIGLDGDAADRWTALVRDHKLQRAQRRDWGQSL